MAILENINYAMITVCSYTSHTFIIQPFHDKILTTIFILFITNSYLFVNHYLIILLLSRLMVGSHVAKESGINARAIINENATIISIYA